MIQHSLDTCVLASCLLRWDNYEKGMINNINNNMVKFHYHILLWWVGLNITGVKGTEKLQMRQTVTKGGSPLPLPIMHIPILSITIPLIVPTVTLPHLINLYSISTVLLFPIWSNHYLCPLFKIFVLSIIITILLVYYQYHSKKRRSKRQYICVLRIWFGL